MNDGEELWMYADQATLQILDLDPKHKHITIRTKNCKVILWLSHLILT